MTQLLYLRNTDITKTSVQGFSLSVGKKNKEGISGGVVIVTVKWHSSKLEYAAEFQRVTMKDFAKKLTEIYELQKRYWIIPSAHSVIGCNASNVWKLPLATTDTLHIFFLAVKQAHQILLPVSPKSNCFERIQGPAGLVACKRMLQDFATSVYRDPWIQVRTS